jgi:hypothetical protein
MTATHAAPESFAADLGLLDVHGDELSHVSGGLDPVVSVFLAAAAVGFVIGFVGVVVLRYHTRG